ncbi:hypothetical protein ACNKCT_000035 [Cronobacter sakazakii]
MPTIVPNGYGYIIHFKKYRGENYCLYLIQGILPNYRLSKLNLDGIIDVVFSPEDHSLPEGIIKQESYQLKKTLNCHTPKGEIKPNPKILLDSIKFAMANPEQCVYIGDSEIILYGCLLGANNIQHRYFFMDGPVTSKESNKNSPPTKLECQKTISLNKTNCTIAS